LQDEEDLCDSLNPDNSKHEKVDVVSENNMEMEQVSVGHIGGRSQAFY
jgi:hypothetical protein